MSYFEPKLRMARRWKVAVTETDNFYYELSDKNRSDLAMLVSAVTAVEPDVIEAYLEELRTDEELRRHLETYLREADDRRDSTVAYGRREGWYAFVRALKPSVVVETGVHDGVGACVLTAAILRNTDEGFQGRYLGTDINPRAGHLLRDRYASVGEILYGDSIEKLQSFQQDIDLFINDSDRSAEYEGEEYLVVRKNCRRSLSYLETIVT